MGGIACDGGILFHYISTSNMYLDSAKKAELFEKHGKGAKDTGSPESQIALFTFRIAHLTGHLQKNKKDYSTQRALRMIIGKRRRMLDYLQKIDIERYRAIIKELGIRR
jgi:ribosomal protein S15